MSITLDQTSIDSIKNSIDSIAGVINSAPIGIPDNPIPPIIIGETYDERHPMYWNNRDGLGIVADPDGYLDSSIGFQKAYAATPDWDTFDIPRGKWKGLFNFNRPVNITGRGPASTLWLKDNVAKIGVMIGSPIGPNQNWGETEPLASRLSIRDFSVQGSGSSKIQYAVMVNKAYDCDFDRINIQGGCAKNAIMIMSSLTSRFNLIGNLNGPQLGHKDRVITLGSIIEVTTNSIRVNTPLINNDPRFLDRVLITRHPVTNLPISYRIASNTANEIFLYNTWAFYTGVNPLYVAPKINTQFQVIDDGGAGWNGSFLLIKDPRVTPSGFSDTEWGYKEYFARTGKGIVTTNNCEFYIRAEAGNTTGGIVCEDQMNNQGNNKFSGCVEGFKGASGVLGTGYGLYIKGCVGFDIQDFHCEQTTYGGRIEQSNARCDIWSMRNCAFIPQNANTPGSEMFTVAGPSIMKYRIDSCTIGRFIRTGGNTGTISTETNDIGYFPSPV